MTRKTSKDVASIAAKWLAMSDDDMQDYINARLDSADSMIGEDLLAEIREMAGSCLSQVEQEDDGIRLTQTIEAERREAIPWTDLKSSNLKRCRFDPVTAELEVDFVSGAEWCYLGVPADVAAQLAISETPGGFFAKNIRNEYEGVGTKAHPESTGREAFVRSLKDEK